MRSKLRFRSPERAAVSVEVSLDGRGIFVYLCQELILIDGDILQAHFQILALIFSPRVGVGDDQRLLFQLLKARG